MFKKHPLWKLVFVGDCDQLEEMKNYVVKSLVSGEKISNSV